MKVFLVRKKSGVNAVGDFNLETKELTVEKGSVVSADIRYTDKFRGANTIAKYRAEFVVNGVTTQNARFKSASTAANFVTGGSTNGLTAWKTEDGKNLKEVLSE